MRAGIIGLPQSGKKTIFRLINRLRGEKELDLALHKEPVVVSITIRDERLELLSRMFRSKRIVFLKMEYLLPVEIYSPVKGERPIWSQVRICDELIHVIRNFELAGEPPSSEEDFWRLEEEMILSDLLVVEKRLEKMKSDRKKGKKERDLEMEFELLHRCKGILEEGRPLREYPELISEPMLKGFTFLTAKPMLLVINNEEDDIELPAWKRRPASLRMLPIRGRLEMELSGMEESEAKELKELYGIDGFTVDTLIRESFEALNKITFFTVGEREARAWTVDRGTKALDAAGEVHTDMKRGFISAEVISFEDIKACGSLSEAKKKGLLRLEGKDYIVQDGDVVTFRFNI